MLRVGIVGSGWVAQNRHIPAYRSHPDCRVAAIVDHDIHKARALASKLGIEFALSDLADLDNLGLDIVSVCTPPWHHAEATLAALAAGAHVLTEKPMAMNQQEAQAMLDAAAAAGRSLCVVHNFLYSHSVRRADAVLNSLGPIHYALGMQLSSPNRRLPTWHQQLPGGLLFDELPHMLYTLQHFLGHLHLEGLRTVKDPYVRLAEIQLIGDTVPAQITTLFTSPISEWHVSVVGGKGMVDIDLFRDLSFVLPSDNGHRAGDILATSTRAMTGHLSGFAASGLRLASGRLDWGHGGMIRGFVDALLSGRDVPIAADDALAVVRLTDSILTEIGS